MFFATNCQYNINPRWFRLRISVETWLGWGGVGVWPFCRSPSTAHSSLCCHWGTSVRTVRNRQRSCPGWCRGSIAWWPRYWSIQTGTRQNKYQTTLRVIYVIFIEYQTTLRVIYIIFIEYQTTLCVIYIIFIECQTTLRVKYVIFIEYQTTPHVMFIEATELPY